MTNLILADPPRQTLRNGLVAYWPLATGAAVDLKSGLAGVGGPFDLTNNAVVTRGAGPTTNLPNACQFVAASSQYLSIADSATLRPGAQLYVSGWFLLDSKPAGALYGFSKTGATGPNFGWCIQWNGSAADRLLFFASTDGTTLVTATANVFGAPALSTFYFVEGWWDGATLNVSVNLSKETPVAMTTMFASTGVLNVGAFASSGAAFWSGRIATPLVLNRVPSLAERQWLYNNGQGRDLVRGV